MQIRFTPLLVTAMLVASTAGAQVTNGSFETPATAPGTYTYYGSASPGTTVGGWTFAGSTGVINGTPTAFNTPSSAPDGAQVAFLQYSPTSTPSSIFQSVTLGAGQYSLSFYSAGRNSYSYTGNTIFDVFLGNNVIGTFTTTSGDAYTLHTTQPVTVAAGTYDLGFRFNAAQPAGDNTAFLDAVQLTPLNVTTTPEPSSLALIGSGLVSLVPMLRRRK